MIYHTVTWTLHSDPSKRQEQMEFALKLAAYAAKKLPDANIQILADVSRPKVYWLDTFESLGAWEAAQAELYQDEGWQALFAEGLEKGLVAPDQVHNFARVVST